jgi:putative endonuclease|tara:strand:+ start:15173 stop:15457 length:285 start_codon:yes stop_codon:yes gene_type:complete
MPKLPSLWFVYMVKASDGSLYTGITTDVHRRFQQHLTSKQGAKYFQGRKPEKIVFIESGHDRSSASKREAEIKSFARDKKLLMVSAAKHSGLPC